MKRRSFFYHNNWKQNKTIIYVPTLYSSGGTDKQVFVSFLAWSVGYRWVSLTVHLARIEEFKIAVKKQHLIQQKKHSNKRKRNG